MLRKLSLILICVITITVKPFLVSAGEVKDVLTGFESVFSPELKYSLEGKVNQKDFPDDLLDSILADLEK